MGNIHENAKFARRPGCGLRQRLDLIDGK